MDISNVHVPAGINFPRITPTGLTDALFVFLAIAIIGTFTRIGLRIYNFRSVGLDDGFLVLALLSLSATVGIVKYLGDITYIQIYASLGLIKFPANAPGLLTDHQLLQAASFLGWITIFSAKFSLLVFLRRLVQRIRSLEILWMVTLVLVIIFACITIPLGFMVCTNFSDNYLKYCPPQLIDMREKTYTEVSTVFDILSDILILSIPAALLWRVQIELKRKLALGAMLGLSVFMIIIAIVRAAGSLLPGDVTDTPWLFFWQAMEGAVAIIVVTLTGLRAYSSGQNSTANASRKAAASYGEDYGSRLGAGRSIKSNGFSKLDQRNGHTGTTTSQEELVMESIAIKRSQVASM